LIGTERKLSSGRMSALTTPTISPKKTASAQLLISSSGMRWAVSSTIAIVMIIRRINSNITSA